MNKVVLIGRLTKDPELRYSSNGNNTAVCNFTLAVNRRFKKEGEQQQADFPAIVAFGKTAEFCSKYFVKGQQVAVAGSIQTRTWDDAEGKRHYVTEVLADEVSFADSKREGGGGNQPQQSAPPSQEERQSAPAPAASQTNNNSGGNTPPWLRK